MHDTRQHGRRDQVRIVQGGQLDDPGTVFEAVQPQARQTLAARLAGVARIVFYTVDAAGDADLRAGAAALDRILGSLYSTVELSFRALLRVAFASRLAAATDFVRVDLYDVDGRIVFGEMTSYPLGGAIRFDPPA